MAILTPDLEPVVESPPTLPWPRTQWQAGRLPCFKIGHLVFFDPVGVRGAFTAPTAAARLSE